MSSIEIFNIEEFKKFIISKGPSKIIYKKIFEEYINAMSQFEVLPYDYMGISPRAYSKYVCRNFEQEGKPTSVRYNTWLLYLFGFKRCHICKSILSLDNYNSNKKRWDNKSEACKNCQSDYSKENSGANNARLAKRRAKKLQAALPGFDKDIKEIYENCPEGFQVDHIVPLQGKHISGLHVPWNLQYLSKKDNLSKYNYHESEEAWK